MGRKISKGDLLLTSLTVSTAAEECRQPQRDLPIGIIATLIVCTVLYVAVAVCLTGLVPWQSMVGDAAPVVNASRSSPSCPAAMRSTGCGWWCCSAPSWAAVEACWCISWASRGCGSRCRATGCCPRLLPKVHPVFRTPAFSTWVAGFVVAIPSGLFDIGTLADLSNIGTLFAFVLVSIGVIVLRIREPERRRGFRVPGGPIIPALSVIFCLLLMAGLPIITWMRFFIWPGMGPAGLFLL